MLYVIKFGGSSLYKCSIIKKFVKVITEKDSKYRYFIVISAIKGITDKLIECGKLAEKGKKKYLDILIDIEKYHNNIIKKIIGLNNQSCLLSFVKQKLNILENICESILILQELSKKSLDKIMSYGEIISSYLIFNILKEKGLDISWVDSRKLIITDLNFGCGNVFFDKSKQNIIKYLTTDSSKYIIVPGFIASTINNETITLGRGGSDYTASIIAASINAKKLEIWTNVSGMLTADPKIVSQAFPIKNISYEEAMELSFFGAKVIYPPTIKPVMDTEIPIHIKNIFFPEDIGTYISKKNINNININEPITGISGNTSISLLTLECTGLINSLFYFKRLFECLSYENIPVIFTTQSSSENSITLGINSKYIIKSENIINKEFLKEIQNKQIKSINIDNHLCIIAIVGDNMKNLYGTSGKIFYILGRNSINIRAISQGSTEKNISIVIKEIDFKKAINILHESLFEKPIKQINLFVIGIGQVGTKLIEQINKQNNYIKNKLKLQLKFIGIANSKLMFFDKKNGVILDKWKESLKNGIKMNINFFVKKLINMNLRNSLFIDNTASKEVSNIYEVLLKNGIGVITCNKIACSSEYEYYKRLKIISHNFNAPFLFETNVGAGLPIISTLNDLINSGDNIIKIEAVLSGSLNFIFNNFNKKRSFFETVKLAQKYGYTEPDPRIDLSGIDVMRKILILARECGSKMEIQDIFYKNFLPKECINTSSINNFFNSLKECSEYFNNIRIKCEKEKKRLRFIAKYNKGSLSVGLESVDKNHPFYELEGKDNMISYLTSRYSDYPLVIKGAGAGSEVTASGIFSDIIKSSSKI